MPTQVLMFQDEEAKATVTPGIERWADVDGDLRWTLGRRWDKRPLMLVIGHNPSTADASVDDPTVRRWAHFANAWGHGGFIAVNLYPFRTPDPGLCRDRLSRELAAGGAALTRNLDVIKAQAAKCTRHVACWGAIADDQAAVLAVLKAICAAPGQHLYCFGVTADGSPKHVMARGRNRVPNDQKPIVWAGYPKG
jgi:hypothetical protein